MWTLPRFARAAFGIRPQRTPHDHSRARKLTGSAALGLLTAITLVAPLQGAAGQTTPPHADSVGGDAQKGVEDILSFGCGTCHTIPGIQGADALVGPPLTAMGRRIYIAGVLRNTPENMIAWIMNPQAFVPGNAMPDMGISESQARDIATYLYTLR